MGATTSLTARASGLLWTAPHSKLTGSRPRSWKLSENKNLGVRAKRCGSPSPRKRRSPACSVTVQTDPSIGVTFGLGSSACCAQGGRAEEGFHRQDTQKGSPPPFTLEQLLLCEKTIPPKLGPGVSPPSHFPISESGAAHWTAWSFSSLVGVLEYCSGQRPRHK